MSQQYMQEGPWHTCQTQSLVCAWTSHHFPENVWHASRHCATVRSDGTGLHSWIKSKETEAPVGAGWALDLVLGAADFASHPSRTVRGHFLTLLRDAWQTRPAMHVRTVQTCSALQPRVLVQGFCCTMPLMLMQPA